MAATYKPTQPHQGVGGSVSVQMSTVPAIPVMQPVMPGAGAAPNVNVTTLQFRATSQGGCNCNASSARFIAMYNPTLQGRIAEADFNRTIDEFSAELRRVAIKARNWTTIPYVLFFCGFIFTFLFAISFFSIATVDGGFPTPMLFGFFLSFAGAIALVAARIYIRNQYEQLKNNLYQKVAALNASSNGVGLNWKVQTELQVTGFGRSRARFMQVPMIELDIISTAAAPQIQQAVPYATVVPAMPAAQTPPASSTNDGKSTLLQQGAAGSTTSAILL